jgi:hypothetical protein
MLKYIEIDSTYRDRKKFPNPSNFEILISQTGTRDSVLTSVDPITYAAPRITYVPSVINSITYTATPALSTSSAQTLSSIICKIPRTIGIFPEKTYNYYKGCQLSVTYTGPTTDTYIITSSQYISSDASFDYFRLTLDKPLTGKQSTTTAITITCSTDFSIGIVFIPTGEPGSSFYKDWYVYNETKKSYAQIITYDGLYSIATIPFQSTWVLTDTISIRKELPIITGTVQAGSTKSSIKLDPLISDKRSIAYTGMFIRFITGTNKNTITGIYTYSGAPTYTAVLLNELLTAPIAGDIYEILQFNGDNYTPFSYSGSVISQESCYDIQLINLIIPNLPLESGGTIASYPYFYVEFYNQSTTGGTTIGTSYSNNPNAIKKLFRVPISDFSTSEDDAFLTMDRSNSLQTIRVNPFGNFKFGVYLPNGDTLTTSLKDTVGPYPPNHFLQISAVFALRRIR